MGAKHFISASNAQGNPAILPVGRDRSGGVLAQSGPFHKGIQSCHRSSSSRPTPAAEWKRGQFVSPSHHHSPAHVGASLRQPPRTALDTRDFTESELKSTWSHILPQLRSSADTSEEGTRNPAVGRDSMLTF